jgi:hypothetical protein
MTAVPTLGESQARDQWRKTIHPAAVARGQIKAGTMQAQATTTKRSMVTKEQQWRWHNLNNMVDQDHHRLNVNDGTGVLYADVSHHFSMNFDEQCVLASSAGDLRVYGDAEKAKHESETGNSRMSVTSLQCGNAAGTQGPTFILLAGKQKKAESTVTRFLLTMEPHLALQLS